MWRYQFVEVPRGDVEARDEKLWELGRGGWELIQVLEGSAADASDGTILTLVFKRTASQDIGI